MTVTSDPPIRGVRSGSGNEPRSSPIGSSEADPKTDSLKRSRSRVEGRVILAVCLGAYFAVALILDFKTLSFFGDAFARMANGSYVLYSRDPHLAAIGFVWNPLTSVCDLVPLLFKPIWPALSSHNVAGSIVSVVCMSGAVYQINAALQEWRVQRSARLVLTALFAINPMIVLYSGNGMSEALYLFTLTATTRYLARWIIQDDLASLVYSAVALGLCYLARNEAIFAALFGGALVLTVSYVRGQGGWRPRVMRGLTDGTIFLIPVGTSFVGWATVSYVITGQPFAQFTSQYGTSAQIASAGGSAPKLSVGLLREAKALEYFAPLIVLIAVIALAAAWHKRDPIIFAPITIVGGGLLFDLAAYDTGSIIWSFRYFIAVLPLEVFLVGTVLAASPRVGSLMRNATGQNELQPVRSRRLRGWFLGIGGVLFCLVATGPSVPATAAGMFNPFVGSLEIPVIGYIFHHPLTKAEVTDKDHYPHILSMSAYVTSLHLPNGDIIVDNAAGCIPELLSVVPDPYVFVIPNNRDFQRSLDDPLTFHVHYIMVPPTADGANDATVQQYPKLYQNGAGFATEVHQFPAGGLCPPFRLYKVISHPDGFN